MHILFITVLLCLFSPLKAVVYESNSIEDLSSFLTEDSLIIFGFDKTVVEPKDALGGKLWRDWVRTNIKQLEDQGSVPKILLAKHLTNLARFAVPMSPIEGETTLSFLKSIKNRDIPYFMLTARPKYFIDSVPNGFAKLTIRQLKGSGIEIPSIPKLENSLYEGFLFTCDQPKGPAVKELFEQNHYFPKRVLYFDNSLIALHSVEDSLTNLGIEFIGFHYQYKMIPENFDPLLSNIKLEVFLRENRFPSEEEAVKIKAELLEQDAHSHFKNLMITSYPKIVEKSFSLMRAL